MTVGFKQHILREEDDLTIVLVTLCDDGEVTITSNSGTTSAAVATRKVSKDWFVEAGN
jgi:hypothetical protein